MRRTKIVATLGPATDRSSQLDDLLRAGIDVVRLNFSHGNSEDHKARVARVRDRARVLGRCVGVLGDLQGPKIRIEKFVEGEVKVTQWRDICARRQFSQQRGRPRSRWHHL